MIQLAEVALAIWGAMGVILAVVVAVVDCFAVAYAAGVRTFVVVSYFPPNLEFSFATSVTAYAITRSPPPLCRCLHCCGGTGLQLHQF